MPTAVWPNGLRTRPDFTSTWQSYKGHDGLDMINFDINHAVMGGTIATASFSVFGGGYIVEVLADNGHLHRYLHNLKGLLVKRGQRVETGQRLGYQGSTGNTTGKHLHFAVRKGGRWGKYIDPLPYLEALVGSSPAGGETSTISTEEQEEDEDMPKNSGFYYTTGTGRDTKTVVLICNTGSGFESEYSNGPKANGKYNNPVAVAFETGSYAPITESHADVIKRSLAQVRASKAV